MFLEFVNAPGKSASRQWLVAGPLAVVVVVPLVLAMVHLVRADASVATAAGARLPAAVLSDAPLPASAPRVVAAALATSSDPTPSQTMPERPDCDYRVAAARPDLRLTGMTVDVAADLTRPDPADDHVAAMAGGDVRATLAEPLKTVALAHYVSGAGDFAAIPAKRLPLDLALRQEVADNVGGQVVVALRFDIAADGRVANMEVADWTSEVDNETFNRLLVDHTVEHAGRWRFPPRARPGGLLETAGLEAVIVRTVGAHPRVLSITKPDGGSRLP